MSLLAEPGVSARDLIFVQPLKFEEGADPDIDLGQWVADGPPLKVLSVELGGAESYREGKQDQSVSYTLYVSTKRGQPKPVDVRGRIWHPEASERNPDGTPNYATALSVDSAILRKGVSGMICVVECGRTS